MKVSGSVRLGFQFRQLSLELVFRNSFAAVELFYSTPNLCIDGFTVF